MTMIPVFLIIGIGLLLMGADTSNAEMGWAGVWVIIATVLALIFCPSLRAL